MRVNKAERCTLESLVFGLYPGDAGRPELDRCLGRLKDGDTLMIRRLDRLGASLRDLIEIVNVLATQKAGFVSITERFDTRTSAGRLVFPLRFAHTVRT